MISWFLAPAYNHFYMYIYVTILHLFMKEGIDCLYILCPGVGILGTQREASARPTKEYEYVKLTKVVVSSFGSEGQN